MQPGAQHSNRIKNLENFWYGGGGGGGGANPAKNNREQGDKTENQKQTKPTTEAELGNRSQEKLVRGERSALNTASLILFL